jgi:sigma-B regulation protein RsbU (phosphoserine phosphatase)
MKALVIDDDPSTQKIMKLLLEKSGFEPVIYSDGQKGCEAALAPEAPSLVILDWMLPDIDGLAVCKKLRAANLKVRPYILFLTSKKEKADAASGLDIGADDFVSKPFNVAELQARLRVARRTLDYQRELQKKAEAFESHEQRNQLLGEISVKQKVADAPAVAKAAAVSPAGKKEIKPTDFSNQEIRFLLSATLMEMRLVLEAAKVRNGAEPLSLKSCDYCAWGGLLLGNDNAWLDIMVALKATTLTALFGKALDRKATSEVEHRYFLAEIARAIMMGFMRTLERRSGGVQHPLMSRTVKVETSSAFPPLPPESKSYDLVIEGEAVQLILAMHECPALELAPASLRELDVLAEQFPSRAVSEIPMFMNGVVLTPRFIEKLVYHVETSQVGELVRVRRPSGMAQYFNYAD